MLFFLATCIPANNKFSKLLTLISNSYLVRQSFFLSLIGFGHCHLSMEGYLNIKLTVPLNDINMFNVFETSITFDTFQTF